MIQRVHDTTKYCYNKVISLVPVSNMAHACFYMCFCVHYSNILYGSGLYYTCNISKNSTYCYFDQAVTGCYVTMEDVFTGTRMNVKTKCTCLCETLKQVQYRYQGKTIYL